MFGAGTNTFRQPQNRRVLRPPGREAQEFAKAESACLGVGGAAERREFRKKFLERSSITGGAKGISWADAQICLTCTLPFCSGTDKCFRSRKRELNHERTTSEPRETVEEQDRFEAQIELQRLHAAGQFFAPVSYQEGFDDEDE